MSDESTAGETVRLTEQERETLTEWLHFYTCYEKYAHYDGVNKCETAAAHVESHWLHDLLTARLDAERARVEAEKDAAILALCGWGVGRDTGGVDRLVPASELRAALNSARDRADRRGTP